MDVKVGSGTSMKTIHQAHALANSIIEVAASAGCKTAAILTRMDQVLGRTAGNALEVSEAIAFLKGDRQDNMLKRVTLTLVGQMLVNAKLSKNRAHGIVIAASKLDDGSAMEIFWKMCASLGAQSGFDKHSDAMMGVGSAPIIREVPALSSGHVSSMNARDIGIAVVELGGGRKLPGAAINHRVGVSEPVQVSQAVTTGDPLCLVHAETEDDFQTAKALIQKAIKIGEQQEQGPLIIDTIDATGTD